MSKKKQKPTKTQQRNTLKGDKLKFIELLQRTWRNLKRKLSDIVGKRMALPATDDSTGMMTMPPSAGGDTAFRLSGVLVMGIVLLIMIFGGILGSRLYSILGMGTNAIKNIPVVYIQDKHTLKFKGPLMETPVTITESLTFDSSSYSLDKNTVISQDGGELLYLNNVSDGRGNLFLRNTNREKPKNKNGDSSGRLVATGVLPSSFNFVENDKAVLYMRGGSDEGDTLLRWSDGKEQVLDSEVHSILGASDDGYLYYMANRNDPVGSSATARLYNLCRIGSDAVKQVLAEGLDGHITEFVPQSGSVLYSLPAGRGELGYMTFSLACWDGTRIHLLTEEVNGLVDFGGGTLLFSTTMTMGKSDPFQYFEDDMAVQDATMVEPVEEDFIVETTNIWGGKKKALDKDAYAGAVAAYEAKQNRDNIRKAIAAQERNVKRNVLHYNAGSSRTVVDSDIVQMVDADADAGVAIYVKERIPTPQKFKVSQVIDPFDAIRLINTVLINTVRDYYYASIGNEPELFMSLTKSERVRAELDGKSGIYFIKEDVNGAGAPLNYISVQAEGLAIAKKLDDNVVSLTGLRYRDRTLYLREDGDDGNVTICAASGQSKDRLVDGLPIYPLPIIYDDVLMCYRDYSDSRQIGNLTLYNSKGKIKPITRNAHSYSYRLPNYIYVLKDYAEAIELGDLYIYSGNSEKLTLVDTEVTAVKTH